MRSIIEHLAEEVVSDPEVVVDADAVVDGDRMRQGLDAYAYPSPVRGSRCHRRWDGPSSQAGSGSAMGASRRAVTEAEPRSRAGFRWTGGRASGYR